MTNSIIKADHLWKSFGKVPIFQDVSLTVDQGTVFGLVGLNGVGKTTLLRLFLGLLFPEKGYVELFSNPLGNNREWFYKKCGFVLEHDGFWGNLSIMDNLKFYAEAKSVSNIALKRYLEENWEETGLLDNNKKVKHLSRGQKMQCALCRAFMGDPDILLLDEPVIALDFNANNHFCAMIKKAKSRGAAVIISSHQLELIDEVCDRVGIIKDKTLSELVKVKVVSWMIVADNNSKWKEILNECGARNVIFNNGWSFNIDSEDSIPECVTKLATHGCRIHGVFKVGEEFSNAIRGLYEKRSN